MARCQDASDLSMFLASSTCAMLRVSRNDVVSVLRFCAERKCMASDILEYCFNCKMARDHAKTSVGREIVAAVEQKSDGFSDDPGEFVEGWVIAAGILNGSGD